MKTLLHFAPIVAFVTLAPGQCVPPKITATGQTANWPSSLTGNLTRPFDPPAYFSCANWALSPLPKRSCSDQAQTACYGDLECAGLVDARTGGAASCSGPAVLGTGIRKFVDTLPGLGPANANNLGQYIPVAVPDTSTYPGSDYYEIELVEYTEKMHSDLPPTKLRGYRQANMGGSPTHQLGPMIVAQKNHPVRIKFTNRLPIGTGGNLFLPVDTTYMGSGMGPMMNNMADPDPRSPMCGQKPKPVGCYTENRATLHLHGGITPWISDGTPHQWITPAGESTTYPEGVSVVNVPDMNLCGSDRDGCQTFYYSNQQSARLMFYHDHSYGITRLNVYAGEAAGYIIRDDAEKKLLADGVLPKDELPLIIQDKTFVPAKEQLSVEDPLWDSSRWGGSGNLWFPHVYMPAQNPGDSSGVNAFGRWMYGPWFWPPTNDIKYPPIPNPYYDPNCNADVDGWCEPPLMPGTPNLSSGMEAFMDTPLVNGTAYPKVTLEPKAYRLRILNAADDRFFNLSLYEADKTGTDVALNPTELAAAQADLTVFPTPDTTKSKPGPSWIQVGTEGGFLPAPVVIPPQPITWVSDPTVFNYGNVEKHALLLGPAERADVIVDLSNMAGKTLILYNDAPAAFPARVAGYDYYTGHPDMTDTGGAPTTLPGYGPNTRTVMLINVARKCTSNCSGANLSGLQTAFAHHLDANGQPAGVFESSQHPIIVGQSGYNSAYGKNFTANGQGKDGFARITDFSLDFDTVSGNHLTMPLQPKALHDEMGGTFDPVYGRMSGTLGLETPNAKAFLQNFILYPYAAPQTEVFDATSLPKGDEIKVAPISTASDGSQIWKITHNGVDTHPIHFHLYDVQLLNRVGWDGIIRKPDANELGWKDTVRISPLEDTFVAVRPVIPTAPFDVPNSVRLIDPTLPAGALIASATHADLMNSGMMPMTPNGEPIDLYNHEVNFGWEYVWHCHILSHEEMDMMRSVSIAIPPKAPTNLKATLSADGTTATLQWADNSANETGFRIERAKDPGFTTDLKTFSALPNMKGYTDTLPSVGTTYYYRVVAVNVVGDTYNYVDPQINEGGEFPAVTATSAYSNVVTTGSGGLAPSAPTGLSAALQNPTQVVLTWMDNATDETGFNLERCTGVGCANFALLTARPALRGTGMTSYVDATAAPGATYSYRVNAVNAAGSSAYSNAARAAVQAVPAAPTALTVGAARGKGNDDTVTLIWGMTVASDVTGYTIQRATNTAFTQGLTEIKLGPTATSHIDTPLPRKTTYYYRIKADNAIGSSGWVNGSPFPVTTP